MLSTELSTILAAGFGILATAAAVFSALAWRIARKSRDDAAALAGWTHENAKSSVTLKRLTELETELTELTDSYAALMKSHKKLRARIGMRLNRQNGRAEDQEGVQSSTDKAQLRLYAKKHGFL